MRQLANSERAGRATDRLKDPRTGIRRRLRVRNILLVIVAVEVIAFDALRWWNVI